MTLAILTATLAVYPPALPPAQGSNGAVSPAEPLSALWQEPADVAAIDLLGGRWGIERAPDADATYLFIRPKAHGVNPGVVVKDPMGRVWHVKQQAHNDAGPEGPVEVVLSRILSAVGYHQPPVYYLRTFTMSDRTGTHVEAGGRFRLERSAMKDAGPWSWLHGPLAETRACRGLLSMLLLFNATDLKDSNNSVYEVSQDGRTERWYVVRDLGSALGQTGRFFPRGDDVDMFERSRFITGVKNGYVEFANRTSYSRLYEGRLTVEDVRWAGELLSQLTDRQWRDAFRAGGFDTPVADRFIRKIHANIDQALQTAGLPAHQGA